MSKKNKSTLKVFATNKRSHFDYHILEKLECGMALIGCEVKSIRLGSINLRDSYVRIINHELWLVGCHILPYKEGNRQNADPIRDRKLLVHKKELLRLIGKTQKKGLTMIPIRIYIKRNRMKLEIGLGQSKKKFDKRQDIKDKDIKRDMQRALKQRY